MANVPTKRPSALSSIDIKGGWQIWDDFLLRSAGFPAHLVMGLSWRDAREWCEEYRIKCHELRLSLSDSDDVKSKKWQDKIRQQLRQGNFNFLSDKRMPKTVQEKMAPFKAYLAGFETDFQKQQAMLLGRLKELASHNQFRGAVMRQSLAAFRTGVHPFIRQTEGQNHVIWRRAVLVASYLQRFCLKNDTIGFFGPLNWAKLDGSAAVSSLTLGADLVTDRRQHFQYWVIYELAQRVIRDMSIRQYLKPCLSPMARQEDGIYYGPDGKKIALSDQWLGLLQLCDGRKTAFEISAILSPGNESAALNLLKKIADNGLVIWQFQVPVSLRVQDKLRDDMNRISDRTARLKCLTLLDHLASHLVEIGQTVGEPDQLEQKLSDMDRAYGEITGKAARHGDKYLFARTMTFEDCQRDVTLTLGRDFLRPSAAVLDLLLTSCRWFTWQLAEQLSDFLVWTATEHLERQKISELPFAVFMTIFKENRTMVGEIIKDVQTQLQDKWQDILSLKGDERAVHFQSRKLREKVKESFAAPMPGWVAARYCTPDLMILAPSLEAVNKGNFKVILGDFHLGHNPFLVPSVNDFHPDVAQIVAQVAQELETPRIMPVPEGQTIGHRTIQDRFPENIYHIGVNETASILSDDRVIPASALYVVVADGRLRIKSRDGHHDFDVIGQADFLFKGMVTGSFKPLLCSGHRPRVSIDNMVIGREEWHFTAKNLSFCHIKDRAHQFMAANIWCRENNLPQYVFLKTPIDGKPIFIDFHNPVYVGILGKYLRKLAKRNDNSEIIISEMLPGSQDLWLKDREGHSYTSELRFVVVDPVPWTDIQEQTK